MGYMGAVPSSDRRQSLIRLWVGLAVAVILSPICGCHGNSTAEDATTEQGVTPGMGPLETGTNRQGRDLAEFGVKAHSAADCSRMCAEEARCKAMSFMGRPESDGICWLKSAVPDPTINPSMVSAVKIRL